MTTPVILEALGAEDESAALRIVAEVNQFVGDVKTLTGKDNFAAQLASLRQGVALARDVESATGKAWNEAIGVVLAWKAAAEQLPELKAQNEQLQEDVRKREVASLVEQGKRDGKLTPATATFWEARGAEELKAFLAVAPRVIPSEVKQPATATAAPIAAAATADGKRYEDHLPQERVALKKSNPELYSALRDDWQKRGKPAGVLANP